MITVYQFPNQWNWHVMLAITSQYETLNKVLQYLNQNKGCRFDTNFTDESINPPCFVHDEDHLTGCVCIPQGKLQPENIMYLAHEIFHLTTSISSINNCQITQDTTQCWSYFFGNMIGMMSAMIVQYNKQKNKKSKKKKTTKVQTKRKTSRKKKEIIQNEQTTR